MLNVYVTVYNETQAFGGPEEGGWWYTQGEPTEGVYTICCGSEIDYGDISEIRTNHAADCPARGAAENYHRQYVRGHKGNNLVRIADAPPQSYPQHTPYYE